MCEKSKLFDWSTSVYPHLTFCILCTDKAGVTEGAQASGLHALTNKAYWPMIHSMSFQLMDLLAT